MLINLFFVHIQSWSCPLNANFLPVYEQNSRDKGFRPNLNGHSKDNSGEEKRSKHEIDVLSETSIMFNPLMPDFSKEKKEVNM